MRGVKKPYPMPYLRTSSGRPNVYYFKYIDPQTGKRREKSTGLTTKRDVHQFIKDFIDNLYNEAKPQAELPFFQYSAKFFIDGKCPRQQRLNDERKPFGQRYMKDLRSELERVVGRPEKEKKSARNPLPFAYLKLGQITEDNIFALRSVLSKSPGGRSGQQAYKAVRIVLV